METINTTYHTETINTVVQSSLPQFGNASITQQPNNTRMYTEEEVNHMIALQSSSSFPNPSYSKEQNNSKRLHLYRKPRGRTTMPSNDRSIENEHITELTVTPINQRLTCTRCTNQSIFNQSPPSNVNKNRKRPISYISNNPSCLLTPTRKRICITPPKSPVDELLDTWDESEYKTLMKCFANYQRNRSRCRGLLGISDIIRFV